MRVRCPGIDPTILTEAGHDEPRLVGTRKVRVDGVKRLISVSSSLPAVACQTRLRAARLMPSSRMEPAPGQGATVIGKQRPDDRSRLPCRRRDAIALPDAMSILHVDLSAARL